MKKFAAHLLYLSAAETVVGPVVVQLTHEGVVTSFERISAELPGVEWLGGIFLLLPTSEFPTSGSGSLEAWYKKVSPVYQPEVHSYALWHVSGIPVDSGLEKISVTAPQRLG